MLKDASRVLGLGALGAVAASILLPTPAQADFTGSVKIDGSNAMLPIAQAIAESFTAINPETVVFINAFGTGSGFEPFCEGNTDINNASRPITDSELEVCSRNGVEFVELLVAIDAVTIVTSSQNNFLTDITTEELKVVWDPQMEGIVTRWHQINSAWPNAPIHLYGPGSDSGTFDFFTAEINGERGAIRNDFQAEIDHEAIAAGVSRSPSAIGYVSLPYYLENQDSLAALAVDGVSPTPENVIAGAYPLARPLFIYVSTDALNRPEISAFVEYYLATARDTSIVIEVGSIPLTSEEYDKMLDRIDR